MNTYKTTTLRMTDTEFIDSNRNVIALRRSRTPDPIINRRITRDEKILLNAINSYEANEKKIEILERLLEKITGWTCKQIAEEIAKMDKKI